MAETTINGKKISKQKIYDAIIAVTLDVLLLWAGGCLLVSAANIPFHWSLSHAIAIEAIKIALK